jgi:hypothetical protein
VLAFGRWARVTHDAQVAAMSSWRCPLGAPHVLGARRDVLTFSRSTRVTHDAQIAQVATMSSWLLLGALFFVPGSKLSQASCCKTKFDGSGQSMSTVLYVQNLLKYVS